MSKIRRTINTIHNFKYKKIRTVGNICAYCYEEADTWDHIPPLSHAHLAEKHIKIPACRSCNTLLNAFDSVDLNKRRDHIYLKLIKNKDYNIPEWDEDELKEVKGFALGYIKKALARQKKLKERCFQLQSKFYPLLADVTNLVGFGVRG